MNHENKILQQDVQALRRGPRIGSGCTNANRPRFDASTRWPRQGSFKPIDLGASNFVGCWSAQAVGSE